MLVFQILVKMVEHVFLRKLQDIFVVLVQRDIQVAPVMLVRIFIKVLCKIYVWIIIGSAITTPSYNRCSPNPCQNGGTCQQTNTGGFMCSCPVGYEGACCERRKWYNSIWIMFYCVSSKLGSNPCMPNPCQNNGICTVSGTSFVCSCLSGFSGQRCETCMYFSKIIFYNIFSINIISWSVSTKSLS